MNTQSLKKIFSASAVIAMVWGGALVAGSPATAADTFTTETATLDGYPLEFTRVIYDPTAAATLSQLPNQLFIIPVIGGQALSFDLGLHPRGTVSGITGLGTGAFNSANQYVTTANCVGLNSGQASCKAIAVNTMTADGQNLSVTNTKTISLEAWGASTVTSFCQTQQATATGPPSTSKLPARPSPSSVAEPTSHTRLTPQWTAASFALTRPELSPLIGAPASTCQ